MNPRVHVVGIAPGVSALSAEAREAVLSCGLLVGAERHLTLVPGFPGEVLAVEGKVAEAVGRAAAEPGLRAAFLASGDPGFYGIAALLLRKLSRDEVRLWPAVSSLQLAFARAGESWSDARFGSLHGRQLAGVAPLLGAPRIGLFTNGGESPGLLARFLLDTGWGDYEFVVAEDLGLPTEKLTRGPAGRFVDWEGSALNVVLLLRNGPDPRPLGPGLADDGFSHSRGLITKAEVRAAALGLLALPRRGVLWDVGAGSGSLSVEACLLSPELGAYAVEKTADGLAHVRENRRRFRVAGLTAVPGEAPAALAGLPAPDAVFVGGSGGRLAAVLDESWLRLRPRGRLVVAAVLVESLSDAVAWGSLRGLASTLTEVRASRSRLVAGRHLLHPENTVTLVRFVKTGVEEGS